MLLVQFVVFLVIVGVLFVAYRHLAGEPSGPALGRGLFGRLSEIVNGRAADAGEPHYKQLSLSMFYSLANTRRARATDNAIYVSGTNYVAVASPRDAVVIYADRDFFEQDLNGLISRNRGARKLMVSGRVGISHVIADDGVSDGEPLLLTVAEARARKLKLDQERQAGVDQRARERYAADALGDLNSGDGPVSWGAGGPSVRAAPAERASRVGAIAGRLVSADTSQRTITVVAPGQRLGRAPHNDVGLIEVSTVSWEHAEIKAAGDGGAWQLVDLGSTNGTRVNGHEIDVHTLKTGDVINFGHEAEFVWHAHVCDHTPTVSTGGA